MQRFACVCLCWMLGCGSDEPPPSAGSTSEASSSESSADDSSSSSGGSTNEHPIAEATIDAAAACSGATMVALVATRFDCVGGGPCTISDPPAQTDGTAIACPSDESDAILDVALTQTGRYHVELLATLDDGTEQRECYSADGSKVVVIDDGEIASRPTIAVTAVGGAC